MSDNVKPASGCTVEGLVLLRLKFLRILRTKPVWRVRNLLRMEPIDEIIALRDACFPEGDEVMRQIIQQEIDLVQNS